MLEFCCSMLLQWLVTEQCCGFEGGKRPGDKLGTKLCHLATLMW